MRRCSSLLSAVTVFAWASLALAHAPCNRGAAAGPVTVHLVGESGQRLPTYRHHGQIWVLGEMGERYSIQVLNRRSERLEIVASVDGRDVLDGSLASWSKRGYLVPGHGELLIEGFRISNRAVASFRFTEVDRSYAARMGHKRDIGVIGIAVFREHRYTRPPCETKRRGWGDEEGEGRREHSRSDRKGEAPAAEARATRPGLGTGFGERRSSPVREVSFVRASSRPAHVLSLRYDDAAGLASQGVDLSCHDRWSEAWRRKTAQPFVESRRDYAVPPPGWDD